MNKHYTERVGDVIFHWDDTDDWLDLEPVGPQFGDLGIAINPQGARELLSVPCDPQAAQAFHRSLLAAGYSADWLGH